MWYEAKRGEGNIVEECGVGNGSVGISGVGISTGSFCYQSGRKTPGPAGHGGGGGVASVCDGITAGKNMSANWSDAANIAYMVDYRGNIYAYTNGSFADTGKTAEVALAVTGFEAKIPLTAFANGATKFGVACDDGAGAILPNVETSLLSVTKPLAGNGPAITLDGNASDWTDEFKVGVGSGSLGDIWAVRTADYLYVLTYVTVPADEIDTEYSYSTNLYIDSDGNTSTGYAYKEVYTEAGGDFLLQDWYTTNQEFSYKTGNGAGFGFSHSAGGCGGIQSSDQQDGVCFISGY